jgi:hypothetical protein
MTRELGPRQLDRSPAAQQFVSPAAELQVFELQIGWKR